MLHVTSHTGRVVESWPCNRSLSLSQVDNLREQLEKETYRRSQLEKSNEELRVQIASLKSFSYNSDHVERSKRQLEEEVLDLRRRLETAQVEQSQVEQYRREAEEKVRQEIQQKLEQVNLFLQVQNLPGAPLKHTDTE